VTYVKYGGVPVVSEEVLIDACPICGESALTGHEGQFSCVSCGTHVEQRRWLGVRPRDRFLFRVVGSDYANAEPDLTARPFTKAELAGLAESCYSDADLETIAAGDLSCLRSPSSQVAQVMFPQTRETCQLQINGLIRAEGPSLSDGTSKINGSANRRTLKKLDEGNLFVSDQRLILPSNTHTIIRIDRKLTGICTFSDAVAIQRKGEDKATYFLGFESRDASLLAAFLKGQLDHLR
jgi:hypothetical protein